MSSSDGLEPTERTDRKGYKRVMLKLGGEMFGGGKVGIDPDVVENVAKQIAAVARAGTEIAAVSYTHLTLPTTPYV